MKTFQKACLIAVLLSGCEPEGYQTPEWEHVTPEEVRSELNQLTGTFVENTPGDILQNIFEESGIVYVANLVAPILDPYLNGKTVYDEEGEWDDEQYATREGALQGQAAAWIRFSCPGAYMDSPITDFSQGYVQLDGDGLSYGGNPEVEDNTNLLLRFSDCTLGSFKVEGSIPAFIGAAADEIAMRAQLSVTNATDLYSLDLPILYQGGGITFPVSLDESRFAVTIPTININLNPLQFSIEAENGVYSCSYDAGDSGILCTDENGDMVTSTIPELF